MGKLTWVVFSGSAALALAVVQATAPQLPPADPPGPLAPDFSLGDLKGRTVRLSDSAGRVRLLNFWATWCGPCRLEMPHLQELHEAFGDRGLSVIGISLDQGPSSTARQAVDRFVRRLGVSYPVVLGDRRVMEAYGPVSAIPTSFLVDGDGRVRRLYLGYRDKSLFEADIRALLAENPPAESVPSAGSRASERRPL